MIIMAIDLGKARTGIAVSDNTMFLASPLCVIEEWNRGKLAEKIAQLVRQEKAELIVMGLPKNMDNSLGFASQRSINFKKLLDERFNIKMCCLVHFLNKKLNI